MAWVSKKCVEKLGVAQPTRTHNHHANTHGGVEKATADPEEGPDIDGKTHTEGQGDKD